jgi:glycosyltransferase involved in cell wall biosynthesis
MAETLISIITPFKNTAQFLPECIDSVLQQSYTNWEMLAIDDGSTDDSFNIVKQYASQDKRIKLYKNEGSGIIHALRIGFKRSRGKLITRMDSDDIMASNKLKVLSDNLHVSGPGHIAIGLVKYFSDTEINEGYSKYEFWLNGLTSKGENYSEIYKECVIPSPCWMAYRTDLMNCNGFDEDRYPEDYDLTFRFYEYGFKCIANKNLLHYWRDYSTRTSRTHPHYSQNYFLEIKMHYFIKLDHKPQRPLTVWGAGFKGKTIAKILIEKNIPFYWICDNPNKIGRKIYEQELFPFSFLSTLNDAQSIITVANSDAQQEIRDYLKLQKMKAMKDYFFFC